MRTIRTASTVATLAALLGPSAFTPSAQAGSNAGGQAVLVTADDSNSVIVFPTPRVDLPTPALTVVPDLPSSPRPHGLAYADATTALAADFQRSRVLVIDVPSASFVDAIPLGSAWDGTGTIAVSPDGSRALGLGNASSTNQLTVITAPFTAASTVTSTTLPAPMYGVQTQGIVFDADGRAFVFVGGLPALVAVLDPPYSSVAFSIPLAASFGNVALTPDASKLLVTSFTGIEVFTAPFSALSTSEIIPVPQAVALDGIALTRDGTRAIVTDAIGGPTGGTGKLFVVHAPYDAGSFVEQLPLPPVFAAPTAGAFEDVAIDSTCSLAIATGNGQNPDDEPALFVEAPFTAADATSHAVAVPGGRGSGAVRIWPSLAADGGDLLAAGFELGTLCEWDGFRGVGY